MPTMEENAETPADRAKAIRAFYESHPYPAPVATLEQRLDRYRDPQRRRAQSLLLWPLEKPRPDRSILVAGCGTSQAARHALMEPDARVTAIDLSETSLRHTRDLQQKHDIRNLQPPPACDRTDRRAWPDVRPDCLHGRASSPERPGRRSSRAARCPCARWRNTRSWSMRLTGARASP